MDHLVWFYLIISNYNDWFNQNGLNMGLNFSVFGFLIKVFTQTKIFMGQFLLF
jgi:hypothetical protein